MGELSKMEHVEEDDLAKCFQKVGVNSIDSAVMARVISELLEETYWQLGRTDLEIITLIEKALPNVKELLKDE